MPIDSANATELATITRELGAEALEGDTRYPAVPGG